MIIVLISSLSFLALVALLKLNTYLLAKQKATNKQNTAESAIEKARQSAIQQEGFDRSKALRAENRKLHGATALRSDAHEYTHEAETPVPGYVPVWVSNGIMSVIIYVTPFSVLPSLTPEQLRTAHYAACAAKETAAIAAFVALPAAERKAIRDNCWIALLPVVGFVLFFSNPIIAILCLPLTLASSVGAIRMKHAPLNAPSEEEIFRAEVLKRL